jgi:hypothetical protein
MRKITVVFAAAAIVAASMALWASPSEGEARKRIIELAQSFKGVPYVYGAESPEAFDCSGFVQYVYRHAADIDIPRNSKAQYAAGTPIEKTEAKPGDIFLFDTVGGGSVSHVAIFLGDNSIIHAISEGPTTGVVLTPTNDRYFSKRYLAARYFIISPSGADKAVVDKFAADKAAVDKAAASKAAADKAAADKAAADKAAADKAAADKVAASKAPVVEVPLAQIGFTVSRPGDVFLDPIKAATGTAIAFTINNGTGKDQVFHIFFYKADKDFSKTKILREARAKIKAGEAQEIEAYTFTDPGRYRINVKTADNTQMMQRTWDVVEVAVRTNS